MKLVYYLIFWIYQFSICIVTKGQIELRIRGSFRLNYFRPLSSDIDLDWQLSTAISRIDFQRAISIHRFFRRHIKVIGEVNLVFLESERLLADVLNPIELNKNPLFLKKLSDEGNLRARVPTNRAEQIVFFARSLNACRRDLFQPDKSLKSEKWNWIYEACGLPPNIEPFEGFFELLRLNENGFSENEMNGLRNDLEVYLRLDYDGHDPERVRDLVPHSPWLYCLFFCRYVYLTDLPCVFSQLQIEILRANFKWECYGALTQFSFMSSRENSPHHLDLLIGALGVASAQDSEWRKLQNLSEQVKLQLVAMP